MVNQNFDRFIKTEAKHKGVYLGSDQPNSHKKDRHEDETNSPGDTDMSVGAIGRDVFKENK